MRREGWEWDGRYEMRSCNREAHAPRFFVSMDFPICMLRARRTSGAWAGGSA